MKRAKPTPLVVKPEFLDIAAPNDVEILIRKDKKVIWINVDGICCLRICRIKTLVVNEEV